MCVRMCFCLCVCVCVHVCMFVYVCVCAHAVTDVARDSPIAMNILGGPELLMGRELMGAESAGA